MVNNLMRRLEGRPSNRQLEDQQRRFAQQPDPRLQRQHIVCDSSGRLVPINIRGTGTSGYDNLPPRDDRLFRAAQNIVGRRASYNSGADLAGRLQAERNQRRLDRIAHAEWLDNLRERQILQESEIRRLHNERVLPHELVHRDRRRGRHRYPDIMPHHHGARFGRQGFSHLQPIPGGHGRVRRHPRRTSIDDSSDFIEVTDDESDYTDSDFTDDDPFERERRHAAYGGGPYLARRARAVRAVGRGSVGGDLA